ncbi:DNA cytosine methyltransferase [Frankia sp. CNm7]|uniref:DNA (cytosine-5-)-methyltransferase n=1 Tax=Frankia nepalensis TaxID=1836974 RepID=A0A937RIH2_9ACTN|nr:DNA cytosine methyltransferase [Frankia nepalensis]MBL7497321.1 DNA cytosine methyltransferase [Frankia nepalensis]MBL7509722.1 DNA cytosine methyltransferase [Frankia nepalensis]MBL7516930.1 DNA cytosine methyltransferase [Frankia nepalensis]MBL7629449.1 DNA cytosine methyltransferase [Frankia nepalensis]
MTVEFAPSGECLPLPWDAGGLPAKESTSLELFSGGGGLAEAMHAVGFRHLLVNEYDRRACETLRLNRAVDLDDVDGDPERHKGAWPIVEGDVHKVSFERWAGRVDVVAGGVPCQPWSLGGVHRGYEDPRNLWPEFARAVRETHPRAFLAENVRGLLRPSFADYWRYTLRCLRMPYLEKHEGEDWSDHNSRLEKEGKARSFNPAERYSVSVHPVNAADYGVPQVRQRVFTIGVRADLGVEFEWRPPTHSESALLRAQATGEYWEGHGLKPRPSVRQSSGEGDPELAPWRTLRDAIEGLPEPLGHKKEYPGWIHHFGWDGAREYPGHTPNHLDLPAKTVKAGVHGVPGGETVLRRDDGTIRYMTVREVARVMTFPDDWHLAGPRGEQMRQLGNAVPVDLGKIAANAVAKALRSSLRVT